MRVLIAIDGSECSLSALTFLAERNWAEGTEFRILSVTEPLALIPGTYLSQSTIEAECELTCLRQDFVNDRVAELKEALGGYQITGAAILGSVSASILDVARDWDADLIVLGSHGRRGFQRLLLGSVAERVARHAACSVEVVKGKSVQVNDLLAAHADALCKVQKQRS